MCVGTIKIVMVDLELDHAGIGDFLSFKSVHVVDDSLLQQLARFSHALLLVHVKLNIKVAILESLFLGQ